jgi:ribosomal protein S2
MKEKNFLDPKMTTYCWAVRDLEDKFHRFDLHHVLCNYNKAAYILAKTTSSRKPVLNGVIASASTHPPFESMRNNHKNLRYQKS